MHPRLAPKQDRDDRKRSLETNAQTNDSSGFIRNVRQTNRKKSEVSGKYRVEEIL